MEHPWPYSDTDPRAMEVWLDLLRRMPSGEKITNALRITHIALQASQAGERLRHPAADDREIFLRAAARRLSRDAMIRVYGWDPLAHEDRG